VTLRARDHGVTVLGCDRKFSAPKGTLCDVVTPCAYDFVLANVVWFGE
jgi:hypothetical protein